MSVMKNCRSALLLFAACLFAFSISAFAFGQETPNRSGNDAPKARQVRRAPRPQFDPGDQASFWFGDLFAEALRGERPQSAGDAAPTVSAPAADLVEEVPAAGGWSEVIAANVLEDEIKRQQNRLGALITNPGQFQSRNIETGEAFSMLATMFAIIASYDGQVRWRDQGEAVAAGLAAAAGRTRTADAAAFRSASEASSRLADLIRGGSFGNEQFRERARRRPDYGLVSCGRPNRADDKAGSLNGRPAPRSAGIVGLNGIGLRFNPA
jgi:hypothetical protein